MDFLVKGSAFLPKRNLFALYTVVGKETRISVSFDQ